VPFSSPRRTHYLPHVLPSFLPSSFHVISDPGALGGERNLPPSPMAER
jgi:hypothetical protein